MNAQDLLTQLISGLQDGLVCYLVVSFAWFAAAAPAVAPNAAVEAVAVTADELPSLAELFARAEALQAQPQAPVQAAAEAIVLPSIRKLKALARAAKIPRYGSMTQLQLWEALGLQS